MSNTNYVDLEVLADSEEKLLSLIHQMGREAALEEFSSHKEVTNPFIELHSAGDIWLLGYNEASAEIEAEMSAMPITEADFGLYMIQVNDSLYAETFAA